MKQGNLFRLEADHEGHDPTHYLFDDYVTELANTWRQYSLGEFENLEPGDKWFVFAFRSTGRVCILSASESSEDTENLDPNLEFIFNEEHCDAIVDHDDEGAPEVPFEFSEEGKVLPLLEYTATANGGEFMTFNGAEWGMNFFTENYTMHPAEFAGLLSTARGNWRNPVRKLIRSVIKLFKRPKVKKTVAPDKPVTQACPEVKKSSAPRVTRKCPHPNFPDRWECSDRVSVELPGRPDPVVFDAKDVWHNEMHTVMAGTDEAGRRYWDCRVFTPDGEGTVRHFHDLDKFNDRTP